MKMKYGWLTVVAVLLVGSSAAWGSMIAVDFGGVNYADAYINATDTSTYSTLDAEFDGSANDRARIVAFGSAYTPVSDSNFHTFPGKSGPGMKYGYSAASINSSTDPVISANYISPSADGTRVYQNNAISGGARLAAAWYWDKDSFLNGANAASGLSFAEGSGSLTAAVAVAGGYAAGGSRGSAFLAQNDGQWYITAFGSTTPSIDAAAANWYVFDPAAGTLFFNTSDYGAAVKGSTFTNITALGMYMQLDKATSNIDLQLNSLQAQLVPEPATIGMLGLGAIIMLLIRRSV